MTIAVIFATILYSATVYYTEDAFTKTALSYVTNKDILLTFVWPYEHPFFLICPAFAQIRLTVAAVTWAVLGIGIAYIIHIFVT